MDAQPLDFIAAADSVIREAPITEESINLLRQRISSRLISHKKHRTLSKTESEALQTLKTDKYIVNKVEVVLGDRTTYIPREEDITKALVSNSNKDLASLGNSKAITQIDSQKMNPNDTALSSFYGLAKVHKPGTPLRPTVFLRGKPTFGLTK
ncbi:unnamed protein product [Schistocephalus solidus]|uniref:Uncharacterized protein n=1 Tax=Schistocephalus solidus TaxID=70667 RepID=A0A183SBG4_SCHSO|nr:unnamed protein product [Schistocephalus solidus]